MDDDIMDRWYPWFKTVNSPWEQVLHLAVKKQFYRDEIIIRKGQLVNELHYLHSGRLKMTHLNSEGEYKTVWYVESGNIFGEAPFISQIECSTTISCVEDSIVYFFNRQVFMEKLLSQRTDIMFNMLNTMAGKIRTLSRKIYDLGLTSPTMRLCRLLYYMATSGDDNELNLSQQDLADVLGVHRVTVNRILGDLKSNGIIAHSNNRKRIIINNPSAMSKLIKEFK